MLQIRLLEERLSSACVCVNSCLMVNLRRFPSLFPVLWCCTLVMHPYARGGFMGQMPNICPLCFAALSLRAVSEAVDLNWLLLLLGLLFAGDLHSKKCVSSTKKKKKNLHFLCSFLESSLHIGYCISSAVYFPSSDCSQRLVASGRCWQSTPSPAARCLSSNHLLYFCLTLRSPTA